MGHEESLALGTGTFVHPSLPDSQELWPTVCSGDHFGLCPPSGEMETVNGRSCLLGDLRVLAGN